MKKPITVLFIALLCCACSQQEPLSTPSEKAKLVTEQIIDNASCKPLRDRLSTNSIDNNTIDEIYVEATQKHCINKDI